MVVCLVLSVSPLWCCGEQGDMVRWMEGEKLSEQYGGGDMGGGKVVYTEGFIL